MTSPFRKGGLRGILTDEVALKIPPFKSPLPPFSKGGIGGMKTIWEEGKWA